LLPELFLSHETPELWVKEVLGAVLVFLTFSVDLALEVKVIFFFSTSVVAASEHASWILFFVEERGELKAGRLELDYAEVLLYSFVSLSMVKPSLVVLDEVPKGDQLLRILALTALLEVGVREAVVALEPLFGR